MKKTTSIIVLILITLSSCVQKEFEKKVTFLVDTNGLKNIESVGIRGDFLPNQWKETMPLIDENKDGIYEITFQEKTALNNISFKFVKNGKEFELQGEDNRNIELEYQPETINYKTKFNNSTAEIIKK